MAGDKDDVRTASRALRDAAAVFSRALGQTLTQAGVIKAVLSHVVVNKATRPGSHPIEIGRLQPIWRV